LELVLRPQPRSTLLPYTTLFRSLPDQDQQRLEQESEAARVSRLFATTNARETSPPTVAGQAGDRGSLLTSADDPFAQNGQERKRSEEHTSELQSHLNLVCRLLLE